MQKSPKQEDMMAKGKGKTQTVYRSSVDGRFITKRKAERNPKQSEKERIRK